MPKPPRSTPHIDLGGARQDERRNADSTNEAGEDSGDLERAHRRSKGRPLYVGDQPEREDRSR